MKLACPECSALQEVADDLPADARLKCRRCGTRFSPGLTSADNAPLELDDCEAEPTGRRSRLILLGASAGLALLLATVAVGWFATRPAKPDDTQSATAPPADPKPPAKADPDPPPAPPPGKPPGDGERLSAPALLTRYGGDREQGAMRYDGASLTVSGKMVGDAEQRAGGEVVIALSGPRPDGERVWCRMDPKADAAVVALLVRGVTRDGYAAARLSAAKGLGRTKSSKESVAALAAAVRGDPEAEVRLAAVNALAWFGEEAKAALKAVEGAKMDPDQRVREAARDAIEKIK